MSEQYIKYLCEHINAVNDAAIWILENTAVSVDNIDTVAFMHNVKEHDKSKFSCKEYSAYESYFFGKKKNDDEFNVAWLHHIHNNMHHWQHWVLVNGYGTFSEPGVVTAIEMPKEFALEMIADWWSFSWRSGNLYEVFDWYKAHKDKIVLHDNTRKYVESILDAIYTALGAANE